MAWELMNEPRCSGDFSASKLQHWIERSAEFLKSVDPNHLVTVGTEGFFGSSTRGKLLLLCWQHQNCSPPCNSVRDPHNFQQLLTFTCTPLQAAYLLPRRCTAQRASDILGMPAEVCQMPYSAAALSTYLADAAYMVGQNNVPIEKGSYKVGYLQSSYQTTHTILCQRAAILHETTCQRT